VSKEQGLPYLAVWASDTLARIYETGEPPEVTGARLRLWLIACKQEPVGTLPDDMERLARWSGLDARAMHEHCSSITGGWKLRNGRYHIRRIQEQHSEVEGRREHGRKAANSRWGKEKTHHARAMPEQCPSNAETDARAMPPSPSPSPSPSPTKKKEGRANAPALSSSRADALHGHILTITGKAPHQLQLTTKRKAALRQRWKYALKLPIEPELAVLGAVMALARMDWHQNEGHTDPYKYALRSDEQFEDRLEKARKLGVTPEAVQKAIGGEDGGQ